MADETPGTPDEAQASSAGEPPKPKRTTRGRGARSMAASADASTRARGKEAAARNTGKEPARRTSTAAGRATTGARKPAKAPAPRRTRKTEPSAVEQAAERTAHAGRSVGEQIFRRVEEMVESGRTAKAAFEVVAKERKMTVSNVQQQYYRFRRNARDAARDAAHTADDRVRATARGAVPGREVDAIRADLRTIGDDVVELSTDVARAVAVVLQEANRSDAARRLRSNVRSMLLRR